MIAFDPFQQFLRRFEHHLDRHGKQLTERRRFVARVVFDFPGPFTPDELYDTICKTHPAFGRATTYRALWEFTNAGLVSATTSEGQTRYVVRGSG